MIGYLDYKDILAEVFRDNDCIIEAPLAKLKGRKLGISFYEIIADLIYGYVKHHSVEMGIEEIKKKFNHHSIETLIVMPGVNIWMKKELLDAFWRMKHEWWKMQLFKDLYSRHADVEPDEFLAALQEISDTYIADSFMNFYVTQFYRGYLVKIFTERLKDTIIAPQNIGNQLSWLYCNSEIDAIMGNPVYFIYNGTEQIIHNIDYTKKKFYFYDLDKFATRVNLTVPQTRLCILSGLFKFLLDKELSKASKFLCASKDKVLEFKKNLRYEYDKRKQVFYDVLGRMRHLVSGNESGLQIAKTAAATFGFNKADVTHYYNLFFKSPVITSAGDVVIHPEKRSLSKTYVLDTSCKELITFYSLGYVDDELFYITNKCTDYTFSIKPPRADSLESDHCITEFLVPHLMKAIPKVWSLCSKPMDTLGETNFKMRLQNGTVIPLNVEPTSLKLFTLPGAKNSGAASFFGCLNEFCTALINEKTAVEIHKNCSLSANELLFNAYLTLLNDLKYIQLANNKVLVIGASFLNGGPSKFEEESILFLEMYKLGIIKGERFKPSNIEDINELTIARFSTIDSVTTDSDEEYESLNGSSPNDPRVEFYKSLKYFEEFTTVQRSLTLYQTESSIDKVLVTLSQIKSEIHKEELPEHNMLCSAMNDALSKHISVINLLSKLFNLGDFKYVNPENYSDYDTHQFDQCHKVISLSCHRALLANLIHAFISTETKRDLSILGKARKELPFNYQASPEVAAILKVVLTKFVVYQALQGHKYSYRHTLAAQIQRASVEDSLNNKLDITEIILNRLEFIDHLLKLCSYKPDYFQNLVALLTEAKIFLKRYFDQS